MKLRPYQTESIDNTIALLQTKRSVLNVAFTGGGKTVIFSHLIKRFLESNPNKKVMVLAERSKIVKQGKKTIERITGKRVDIEMAGHHVDMREMFAPDIVIGTVQTQSRGGDGLGRIGKFDPMDFSLVVCDEAHHSLASSYRKIFNYYFTNPECRLVGYTATPDRADEQALGQVFDAVAINKDIEYGVNEGWLVRPRQQMATVASLDISAVGTVAGDFNAGELSDALALDKPLYEIACIAVRECGEEKAIVFAVSVKQAERLTDVINALKPASARFVHGGTPEDERDAMYHDYAERRFQFLVNVGITVEGFDDPGVSVIVDAAMTKSRAKYTQKLGRELRPDAAIAHALNDCVDAESRKALIADSAKPTARYIDLVGNSGRHKPVFLGDVLGGKYSDEVRERAKKRAIKAGERGESVDIEDELRKAEAELELKKKRDCARRAKVKAEASYTLVDVDPFNAFDIKRTEVIKHDNRRKATPGMIALLQKQGVKGAENMSFWEALELVKRIKYGWANGLASLKQTALLKQFGYKGVFKREEAKRILDEEFARRKA